MCEIGDIVSVRSVGGDECIIGWRVMKKNIDGSFGPCFRDFHTYNIGYRSEAINPYSFTKEKIISWSDVEFMHSCSGFWCLKSRKLAREWREKHYNKDEYKYYRIVKVKLLERMVVHSVGYRAQAMIPLAVKS